MMSNKKIDSVYYCNQGLEITLRILPIPFIGSMLQIPKLQVKKKH